MQVVHTIRYAQCSGVSGCRVLRSICASLTPCCACRSDRAGQRRQRIVAQLYPVHVSRHRPAWQLTRSSEVVVPPIMLQNMVEKCLLGISVDELVHLWCRASYARCGAVPPHTWTTAWQVTARTGHSSHRSCRVKKGLLCYAMIISYVIWLERCTTGAIAL